MGLLDALRRMITLPRRWNSLSDIRSDPVGALDAARDVLRSCQFLAAASGNIAAYDRLAQAIEAIDRAKLIWVGNREEKRDDRKGAGG